jgi:hypothetical protein
MAKANKRSVARKKNSKSVKVSVNRKTKAKRATTKAKSKAIRSSKRPGKPASAKRPKVVERKETVTDSPIESTVLAVEQPAPAFIVVEEVVVGEERTGSAGSADLVPI